MADANTIKQLTIDINRDVYQIIEAKQNDIGRFLEINLIDNGLAYNLTGLSAKIYAIKADNNIIFNNVTIEDTTNGVIQVELTSQALAVVGELQCELSIYGADNTVISSHIFVINVLESIRNDSTVESANEYTALTQALSTVGTINNKADKTYVDSQDTTLQNDINEVDEQLAEKADDIDSARTTTSKTVTGAINELESGLNTANTNITNLQNNKADITYVNNKIGSIGNTKTFKGSCTFANLPTTGNANGDYYYVTDRNTNYCWNGSTWVDIGNNMDVGDGIVTKSKLESKLNNVFGEQYASIQITWNTGAYYYYGTKATISDANSKYSNPITVAEGDEFKVSGSYNYNAKTYVILDGNGNVLAYCNSSDTSAGKINNLSFIIPKGGTTLILNGYIGSDTTIKNNTVLLKATKYSLQQFYPQSIQKESLGTDFNNVFAKTYTAVSVVWNAGAYCSYVDGTIQPDARFSYSNPIAVTPGDQYKFTGHSVWNANPIIIKDVNGTIIYTFPNSYLNTDTLYTDQVFSIPDGGTTLILNMTSVQTYLYKLSGISPRANTNLAGIKIAYNGDSICAGDGNNEVSYPDMIASNTNGTFEKRAIGGGTVASGTGKSRMVCTDVQNMAIDADIVCFEGGANDYWLNVPLGTLDTTSATRFTSTIDTTTFAGALDSVFRQAIARWPGKPICYVIVHKLHNTEFTPNANGNTFTDYVNMIISACNKYSIPYVDLFHNSCMITDFDNIRLNYTHNPTVGQATDGIHPNQAGYEAYYVPQITAKLNTLV